MKCTTFPPPTETEYVDSFIEMLTILVKLKIISDNQYFDAQLSYRPSSDDYNNH